MAATTDDYPLNCIENTGDGFSGWFAISNTRQCNDFCYWHQNPSGARDQSTLDDDDATDGDGSGSEEYTASNTADPHQTTVIYSDAHPNENSTPIAYWVCVYDAADDSTLTSMVNGQSWIESFTSITLWATIQYGGHLTVAMVVERPMYTIRTFHFRT
eukprot:g11161.t1 g11161   contig5:240172-240645(+)